MPLNVKQIETARFGVQKERLSDGSGRYIRLFSNGAKRFQVRSHASQTRQHVAGLHWVTILN